MIDHLSETDLLPMQSKGDEIECWTTVTDILEHGESTGTHGPACDFHLHEAGTGTRKSLLEQLKRVVIVEDFDGVSKSSKLFCAVFDVLIEQFLLRCTIFVQIFQELGVISKPISCVTKIVLHLLDLDTKIANTSELLLNHSTESVDLLLFCCHQALIVCNCCLLCSCGVSKICIHFVEHRLQDACDFTTGRGVLGRTREERQHILSISIHHLLAVHGQLF